MMFESTAKEIGPRHLEAVSESGDFRSGSPLRFAARRRGGGTDFALFSRPATRVRLRLCRSPGDSSAYKIIHPDPVRNRTGDIRHIWVQGLVKGLLRAVTCQSYHSKLIYKLRTPPLPILFRDISRHLWRLPELGGRYRYRRGQRQEVGWTIEKSS